MSTRARTAPNGMMSRWLIEPPIHGILFEWYLAQFSVEHVLGKFHALVFEYLCILFDDAVQRHADLPGPRENFGIFDSGFVVQMILVGRCEAFDNMQCVAVKIAGS